MKIAFVSTILNHVWGGADTLWTHAAEAAVARGDDVLLAISGVVAAYPRIGAMASRGAAIFIRPAPNHGPAGLAQRATRKLRRLVGGKRDPLVPALASFAPDVVVISGGGTYDLLLEPELTTWLLATGTPFRVIANWQRENPSASETDRETLNRAFARADAFFFVSTRNLASSRRHLLAALDRARVIHNPLRSGRGAALPWPRDPTTLRLATVSRLHCDKGIALLLHALKAALGESAGWQLHIVGDGPEEPYLRRTVAALALEDRVHFCGRIESLPEIWRTRHLLVSASLEDGVPMTIPEAMLLGRPVIATRVGGAEDWIRDGETGFLCSAPTLPLLADTLRTAWSQRERWPALGQRAAASAAAQYRPDDYLALIAPPVRS